MNPHRIKDRLARIRAYRPRLLPALLLSGTALFGLKLMDVWNGAEDVMAALGTPAQAREEAPNAPAPASPAHAPAAQDGKAPAAHGPEKAASEPGSESADDSGHSESELQVLQSLSKRREDLVGRERQLEMRETMLKAAEQRVDQKIAKLSALQGEIQKLLHQNDQVEEERLRSLVKVYETMKPKDAARIFENLDQNVLLDVTERMKEAKIAPILASMDPAAAQAVTVKLATRRKLPDTSAAAAPAESGAPAPAASSGKDG